MEVHTSNSVSFSKTLVLRATTPPLISHVAFHAIIWTGVSLCILTFSSRMTIRVICFRRLFVEDYVMLLSLVILVATAITIQILVPYRHDLADLRSAHPPPSLELLKETAKGLRGHVALMVMNYIGIWLIKFSFLVFLYRLGDRVTKYRIFWWIVLVFNIAAGLTAIGIIDFECLLSPVERIVLVCDYQKRRVFLILNSVVSSLLDALGDVMIICFPVYVLWNVRIDVRNKIVLTALFSLVVFTILISIIRGSVFGGVNIRHLDKVDIEPVNLAWVWFWLSIEYIISFIVACFISFRCLFTQMESDTSIRDVRTPGWHHRNLPLHRPQPKGFREKVRNFRNSMRDTLMTLEGFTRVDSEVFVLPTPPAGSLSLNFEEDEELNRE
ncbi:hypothetical protein F4805DRAFT_419641 [Annulohypoxylon moriforme]|nr:hypothetical protein F4805DRAFT_419641 [Annulohypoxylon moriforme]